LVLAVSKSVLPVKLELDNLGYDGIWFMCVFLVAAYIRLYGIAFFSSLQRSLLCYVASSLLIFTIAFGVRFVYMQTGSLGNFIQATYSYNHVLVLFSAVSLFYVFHYLKLSPDTCVGKWICRIAPCTLGVYLLHEQIEIRMLWPKWLGATLDEGTGMMLLRALGAIVLVFVVGICIDAVRRYLFLIVKKGWRKTALYERFSVK